MVVARSRIHYWMAFVKPRRDIDFVRRKIWKRRYCISYNHEGDISSNGLISQLPFRVLPFPIFYQFPRYF